MSNTQLLNEHDSLLVIIDMQQHLAAAMSSDIASGVINQTQILLTAANVLSIPIIVTEQYPKGLGSTVTELKDQFLNGTTIIEKTSFSCADVAEFSRQIESSKRTQIILAGMETHICIMQSALDLQQQGYQVFVVEDAVSSRTTTHQDNALQRMRQAGIIISNVESIIFEWLGDAQHPAFRRLSKLIV